LVKTITNVSKLKDTDYFETPKKEFLDACYFFGVMPTLDVCATSQNTKCHEYFSCGALEKDWNQYSDTVAYMNPPYSQSKAWVKYAYMQHVKHNMTILALLQSHTGNSYFHNYIVDKAEILFWRGRIRFLMDGVVPNYPPKFDSMFVLWRKKI